MRNLALFFGILLVMGGIVWMLQGLNVGFAPRSFMTGNSRWVAYGGATVLVGLALGMFGRRGSR